MSKLILASSSPRRQELLQQVNIPFQIRKPDVDESAIATKDPEERVKQLAQTKGRAVPILEENEVIIAADTVVSLEGYIFEKPKNRENAREMITALSGMNHDVFSGVMIRSEEKEIVFAERTEVAFWPLTEELIDWYISTKEPYDKAGAYGIQSLGAILVKGIIGDYYNVVGLPLARVVQELQQFSIYPHIEC